MESLLVFDFSKVHSEFDLVVNGNFPANNSFNSSLLLTLPSDKIGFVKNCEEKYSVNGGKTKRVHHFSLLLPRCLDLDFKDLIAIGALQGELRKSEECASDVKFTSSEPLLHNLVLRLYKKFGIRETEVSWRIVGLRHSNDASALSWWGSKSRFRKSCFKSFRHSTGRILSKTPEFGTVEAWVKKGRSKSFNNTLFFHTLRSMIGSSLNSAEVNSKVAVPILKGLFAAEGFVDVKSRFCGLACTNQRELKIYSRILAKLGIRSVVGHNMARFASGGHGTPVNFEAVKEFDLFECCERKKEAFDRMFTN